MTNVPSFLPTLAPLIVSFTLFALFLYLYLTYKRRFIGIWTAGWALWTLQLGIVSYYKLTDYSGGIGLVLVLGLAYTTLILLGAAALDDRPVLKIWLPLAALGILFYEFASATGYGLIVIMLITGIGWIWAGHLFKSSGRQVGHVRWIPAICLIGMGFHQWALPIYRLIPTYSPWAFNITLVFQLGIAIGVLVVFTRAGSMQLAEANAALKKSLSKALSGFIPICANCNSIRDQHKKWCRLETYISARTDAQFSHSICPDCAEKLYPELDLLSLRKPAEV